MTPSRFVELPAEVARCVGTAAPARTSARRLLSGRCIAPAHAADRARAIAEALAAEPPGRVASGGRFADAALRTALLGWLPAALAASLRPGFEWYGCRGAHFHTDAHYGDVLFGAWCLAGPPRDLVFARSGARVAAGVGDLAVFDPFEPHAVLERGDGRYERSRYATAAASVFVGFELDIDAATSRAFGLQPLAGPQERLRELSSRVAVNAETGELA